MRYALRNIIRLKLRSILCFMIIFAIFFLAMFGFLIRLLSEDNREHFYGPLDGSVHVTTEDLKPYIPMKVAVGKWVSTIVVNPLIAALAAGVMQIFAG